MVNVYFSTYPSAFDPPRGGERQLTDLVSALRSSTCRPIYYNMWQPRIDECDIFHYFSTHAGSLAFCHHLKERGVPIVVTPNLTSEDYQISCRFSEIKEQLNISSSIVASSHIEKSKISNTFSISPEKIQVIHLGVPNEFFEDHNDKELITVVDYSKPFLLLAGEIGPGKKIIELIAAMRKVDGLRLVLVGDIIDEEYASRCIDAGGDNVLYLGSIPRTTSLFMSLLGRCSALVVPAKQDGISMAAIEAYVKGRNIIINDTETAREYFGDSALYCEPTDIESVTRSICHALDRGRPDYVVNREYLSINRVAKAHITLYQGICDGETKR